MQLMPKVIILF